MMMELRVIFIGLVSSITLLFFLYKVNYKPKERYRQLWSPILAVIFTIIVFRFDLLNISIIEMLFERYPSLNYYVLLVFNVILLITFLGIKFIFKIAHLGTRYITTSLFRRILLVQKLVNWFISNFVRLIPHYWRYKLISNKRKDPTVSFFYERDYRGIYLKPEWYYTSLIFRYASFIAFFVYFIYIILLSFEWKVEVARILPEYPALALIIFLEIAWFLGGEEKGYRNTIITGDDAYSTIVTAYNELFKIYKEIWPERILASNQSRISPINFLEITADEYNFYKDTKSLKEEQLKETLRQLKARKVHLRDPYIEMLRKTIEGKSILIEDPLYGEAKDFLIPAITNRLINHHRIIAIFKDQRTVEEAKDWLQLGFQEANGLEYLWSIIPLEQALKDNLTPHILLIDVQQILEPETFQFITEKFHGISYDTVLIFEGERILATHTPELQRFSFQLSDKMVKKTVYWVFSQWYEGLETTVRQVFRINPEDLLARTEKSPYLNYIIWKSEGEGRFQDKIFPKLAHRYIDGEAVLSIVAQQFDVGPMQFVNQGKYAVTESLNELLDNRDHLKEFGLSDTQIRKIQDHFYVYDQYWAVPRMDHAFMFVRDVNYDLVDTLAHWWSNGKVSTFIHVISPPYLLRDYLVDNLSFHMISNRKVSPLSLKQPVTPYGRLKPLIDRLMNGFVAEKEILEALSSLSNNTELPVIERLQVHLQQYFNSDEKIMDAIKVRKRKVFNEMTRTFDDEVSYKITHKLSRLIPKEKHEVIKVMKLSGNIIERISAGHLLQRYLPGQSHAFLGELYRIDKIDFELGVMEVTFLPQRNSRIYKQNRTYEVKRSSLNKVYNKKVKFVDGTNVVKRILEEPVKVITKGYLSFERHVTFLPGQSEYEKLKTPVKENVERHYNKGKILEIEIGVLESVENKESIAFTFTFLLNELFVTLFPHSHDYIKATTLLSDDFFSLDNELYRETNYILKQLHPKLNIIDDGTEKDDGNSKKGKYSANTTYKIYIFEDSPTQLGLVESLYDSWNYVMELLEDYLRWLLKDLKKNGEYLSFGLDNPLPYFDFENTWELVQSILPGQSRQKMYEGDSIKIKEITEEASANLEKKVCAFCRKEYIAVQYEVLDDLRNRCKECQESAINEVSQLRPLYKQIRHYLNEQYGIELRKDIHLSIVSAKKLNESSGLPFFPEEAARILGKASIDERKDITVMIENGAPKLQTYLTLVHELTHVWQFDNLNYRYMTLEELEGFATWVEIELAKHFEEDFYVKEFLAQLKQRNDVYSRGYFELIDILENHHHIQNPFQLFGEGL